MIVILGNTNDEQGNLSLIAKGRCDTAIALWKTDKTQKIITTGTYGAHFNVSHQPHSYWLNTYLTGTVPEIGRSIAGSIVSMTTYQDMAGLRKMLSDHPDKDQRVYIITSDFHYGRVKFYFDLIIQPYETDDMLPGKDKFEIIRAPSDITKEEEKKLLEYEQKRMQQIMIFPAEVYNNACAEQKHYDNVSIAMITGQFATFALGFKFITDKFPFELSLVYAGPVVYKLIYVCVLFTVIILFWQLYLRSAKTARAARRTVRNLERCHAQFGFSALYATANIKGSFFTFKRLLECIFVVMGIMLFIQVSALLTLIFLALYYFFVFDKKDK